jgi:hypothetical protein
MFNTPLFESLLARFGGSAKVKSVEITCQEDQQYVGWGKFVGTETPRFHPIFDDLNTTPTDISKLMNLPLLVRMICPRESWKGRVWVHAAIQNPEVECLDINVVTSKDTWGVKGVGGVPVRGRYLLIREDMKDITPHHVEAMVAFFRNEIYPKIVQGAVALLEWRGNRSVRLRKIS